MIEQSLIEYLVNALWQIPLLAGSTWLLLRMVRPGPRMQHGVWLAVLGLAVLLPTHGMGRTGVSALQRRHITLSTQEKVAWSEPPALPKTDWRRIRGLWLQFSPRMRRVNLAATTGHWLVRLYLATMVFALFRIARAWCAARHLVEHSQETTLCARDSAALEDYCRRLGVKPPQLRESAEVPSPMIVGVTAPVLLLPEGFAWHTEDEVRAALCHELAHIQRRDYLVNAICQLAALPVVWHPVMYGVQQCIRRTREMVCDAMAAQEMKSEIRYAKCLLALAQSMLGGRGMAEQAQLLGLFSSNILEERVMRLVETKTMSVRAKAARVASGAALMIATTSIAAMFHVMPTMAQSTPGTPPEAAQNAPAASPSQLQDLSPVGSLPASTVHQEPQPAPAGQRRSEQEWKQRMADAQRRAAEAAAEMNSPEFKQQIADAQRRATEAAAKMNSPEFRQQIADAQRRAAEAAAKMNSPEFRQQIADAQRRATEAVAKLNSPEFKQQIADAQRHAEEAVAKLNSPEFRQQIADAQQRAAEAAAKMNSPEFKQQIADAQRRASEAMEKFNSPEFKQKMADIPKRLQSDEMQRRMEEVSPKGTPLPKHPQTSTSPSR
jgi:beta-lactamase regulating signal transducer with metallopeptidase domain